MLFMIMLSGMSLVLLAIIVGQIGPSYAAQKGTKTVYAAQAGLQAALGVIRNVGLAPNANNVVYGNLAKLPCSVSGNADGVSSNITYTARVTYFTLDPTNRGEPWINNPANQIPCSPTSGLGAQPNYAYVVSKGVGVASPGRDASESNRSIAAVYKFRVTRVNVPGGRILNVATTHCLQAEPLDGVIKAGSRMKFVPRADCIVDTSQLWVHDATYQIKLASTITNGAAGLCITGVPDNDATLQPCQPSGASDTLRYNQLWSWTGATTWSGQKNPISAGPSNAKLGISSSYLRVSTAGSGLSPEPAVGAGAAGKATNQIVNYKEFGRCFDVTDEQTGKAFMQVYPCKQDPTGTGNEILWNHKAYYTEPATGASAKQQIFINYLDNTSRKFCLTTPADGPSGYPTLTNACNSATLQQQWTRYNQMSTFESSYVFVDTYGRCLTAELGDRHAGLYSRITVRDCDGTPEQKWNAPPSSNDAEFGSFKEIG